MPYGINNDITKNLKIINDFDSLTIGTVIDTNDPQQMGRIRVFCPAWDSDNLTLSDVPWAIYMTPFGGSVKQISRGPEDSITQGTTTYGMWGIPKVGAKVIIMCIDKNPHFRIWMGCIYDQFLPHTMPNGRFIEDGNGPLTSSEKPIEPITTNFNKAFNNDKTYEWKTRIEDYSVTSINNFVTNNNRTESNKPDNNNNGYKLSRINPNITINNLPNLDSQIYSWTTPGFHSISMDDSSNNSRMKFRTSSGHQILLDDTNERIYIMTCAGDNYIEMDKNGNIDIFSNRRVSVRSKSDINFTSDETIRLYGKKGIYLSTENGDIGIDAKNSNFYCNVDKNYIVNCKEKYSLQINKLDILSKEYITINSNSKINIKGETTNITGLNNININGGSNTFITSSSIHLNGPNAIIADSSIIEPSKLSFLTNRVPDHEPWPRVIIKSPSNNIDHTPEFEKNDLNVNKFENGENLNRNKNWRR